MLLLFLAASTLSLNVKPTVSVAPAVQQIMKEGLATGHFATLPEKILFGASHPHSRESCAHTP